MKVEVLRKLLADLDALSGTQRGLQKLDKTLAKYDTKSVKQLAKLLGSPK